MCDPRDTRRAHEQRRRAVSEDLECETMNRWGCCPRDQYSAVSLFTIVSSSCTCVNVGLFQSSDLRLSMMAVDAFDKKAILKAT